MHVRLPSSLSTSRREDVIRWPHAHRSQLRRQRPFWLTRISGGGNHYRMDIITADDAKGTVVNGLKFFAPGRASSFDYA